MVGTEEGFDTLTLKPGRREVIMSTEHDQTGVWMPGRKDGVVSPRANPVDLDSYHLETVFYDGDFQQALVPDSPRIVEAEIKRREEFLKSELDRERIWRKEQRESHKLWWDFQSSQAHLFSGTLSNAANTYRLVTGMSVLMFAVGLFLFASAVLYAVFVDASAVYPALFAGMGAATFVTLLIKEPLKKAQLALTDLMQAEVCFMNQFEVTRLWGAYPYDNWGRVDEAKLKVATKQLERLTEISVALRWRAC
jgi:hypothetical protein